MRSSHVLQSLLLLVPMVISENKTELSLSRQGGGVVCDPNSYNFDENGADWPGLCQTGQQQSPIDLYSLSSTISNVNRIRFYNYNIALRGPLRLVNNGHTANMDIPVTVNNRRPYITGGYLPGRFEAQSVHFHWGSPNSRGSEHFIDDQQYDVEMHIVHKNVRYATTNEASANPDGLAVLGVMIRSVPGNPRPTGVTRLLEQLPRIPDCGDQATISGRLTAGDLLGNIVTGQFFSYNGSLTTPPCSEAVTWTVFTDVMNIARNQIAKFFGLRDARGQPLLDNFRIRQDLNGREHFAMLVAGKWLTRTYGTQSKHTICPNAHLLNYDKNGEDWDGLCGTGAQQSPIELAHAAAIKSRTRELCFINYEKPLQLPLLLVNNGHTAELEIRNTLNGRPPCLVGCRLRAVYRAIQIHFHWGSASTLGSEHIVDAKRFDAELHIVHIKSRYKTINEALVQPDGFVVLGVLLNCVEQPRVDPFGLHTIMNYAKEIAQCGDVHNVSTELCLSQFLCCQNTSQFFTYRGSLTTPPCAENVTWFVFTNAVDVAREQLKNFWKLRDSRGKPLVNNYRKLQSLNSRKIFLR